MFNFFKKSKKESKEKRDRDQSKEKDLPAEVTSAKDCVKNNYIQKVENASQGGEVAFGIFAENEPLESACASDKTTAPTITISKETIEEMSNHQPTQNGDVFSYTAAAARQSPHCVKPCGHGTIAISPRVPLPAGKKQNDHTPPESPKIEYNNKFNLAKNAAELESNAISVKSLHHNGSKEDPGKPSDNSVKPPAGSAEEFPSIAEKDDMKNLINQEAKFQKQLNELNQQLAQRDADASKLRFQLEELQRDVFTKSAGIDRLQSELQAAHKESEGLRQKLKHIEDEMAKLRDKNSELEDGVNSKTETYVKYETETKAKIQELENVIKELQAHIEKLQSQVEELSSEKEKLEKEHSVILNEKEEQKKLIEQALDEALNDKSKVDKKWEQEFEKLRTVSIVKEQQTFEDFEWKLREVEQMCKKKLQEKDKDIEERLQEAYKDAELKLKLAEEMMEEVQHLKSYEAEVRQLRGLTQEQEKSIQIMSEQQGQMQRAEENLKEESRRLRKLIDTEKENLQHLQRLHHQELVDKERRLHNRLEEKKTEIAMYWEERLLHECGRLKSELEQLHNEEKAFAMDTIRKQKTDEFNEHKKKWEEKLQESLKEISHLKQALVRTDEHHRTELERQQTKTDRDIMELRRLMNKLDMVHHNNYEKMVQNHEDELERINEEHEQKVREIEMICQNQVSSVHASLELVKEQMAKDSQTTLESLIAQHRSELDTQWANLIYQKSEAIKLVENEYVSKYNTLEDQFHSQQKSHEAREIELLKSIDSLKNEIASKDSGLDDLQNNVDTLEGGVQVLNCTIRNLQKEMTDMQAQFEKDRSQYETTILQMKKQTGTTIDHLQRKCECLTKLFEEVRTRYERRESRQEDLNLISDLRQVIAEQEKDLACINEEKRYYQMKLMSLQRSIDEDEEDFVDTEDFAVVDCAKNNNSPNSYQNQSHATLSIPPTIPECEDCDDV